MFTPSEAHAARNRQAARARLAGMFRSEPRVVRNICGGACACHVCPAPIVDGDEIVKFGETEAIASSAIGRRVHVRCMSAEATARDAELVRWLDEQEAIVGDLLRQAKGAA